MINDIRFQASQLLQLQDNTAILGNYNTQKTDNNIFEELMQDKGINKEDEDKNNSTFIPLGMPAGFNIDFSLLEEMEKSS